MPLRPLDESLYYTGPRVVQWPDKSGHGNTLTSHHLATQPNLRRNALTGRPVVSFPMHGQSLRTASAFGVTGDADRTLITVQHYLVVATGTNTAGQAFGIDFAPDMNIFYLPYHWLGDNIVGNRRDILGRWNVDVALHHFSVSSGRVDGTVVGSSRVVPLSTLPAPLTMGTRVPGDGLSRPGEIAEMLYYSRALDREELRSVESYLGCKWGLQADFVSYTPSCDSYFTPASIADLQAWYDATDASLEVGTARSSH